MPVLIIHLAHFHEKPFVNYALIGHSVFGVSQSVAQKAEKSDTVRIVHAPTRPEQKGTPQIRAAIEALREKGHKIEFIELINRPNSDVLLELSKSDFAIDELYSDISLAVFGNEAAYFAKPALVGGYAQKELQSISSLNGLPVDLYVRPEKLQETIEKLILDQGVPRCMRHKGKGIPCNPMDTKGCCNTISPNHSR